MKSMSLYIYLYICIYVAIRPTNPGPRSRKLSYILYTAKKYLNFLITCETANQYDGKIDRFLCPLLLASHC